MTVASPLSAIPSFLRLSPPSPPQRLSVTPVVLANFQLHKVCPEGIQSCTIKNRDIHWRRYKKHCTQDNDVSVPFRVGTLGPHTVLPGAISCPIIFSWLSWTVWHLSPFKGDFSFGKNQKFQGTKSGQQGGWVTWVIWVLPKISACDAWVGMLWWSCQSPVAHTCGLLNHLNSFHRGMFKLNAKFDADSWLYSLILNAMATQYTCSLNGIYCPHWLVSTVKSLFTHAHSSPLSLAARLHLISRKQFLL